MEIFVKKSYTFKFEIKFFEIEFFEIDFFKIELFEIEWIIIF